MLAIAKGLLSQDYALPLCTRTRSAESDEVPFHPGCVPIQNNIHYHSLFPVFSIRSCHEKKLSSRQVLRL